MKRVQLKLLLALSLTAFLPKAQACSCIYLSDYFCPSVYDGNSIILGVVLNKYLAGPNQAPLMDIATIEWLKTEDPTQDTISVLGQDGLNCNESLFYFSPGDTVVLALYGYGGGWHPVDISPYPIYNLSGCGRYFLSYSLGNVVGPIRSGVAAQPLEDFKAGLEECIALMVTGVDELIQNDQLIPISPVPASEELYIEIHASIGSPDRLRFFNAQGQLLNLQPQSLNDQRIRVDVSALSPGVYFVLLEFGNARRLRKWIKA